MKKIGIAFAALAALALAVSCGPENKIDPNASNERSIISIKLQGHLGDAAKPEIIDDESGRVDVKISTNLCPDLSKVKVEELVVSYKATASVAVGGTIDLSSGMAQIVVTSESGKTRTYNVYNEAFTESFVGKYAVKSTAVFGGVGEPDWGGLELIDPIESKSWLFDASNAAGFGPAASNDDYFEITLDKVNEDGTTEGTCVLYGGQDGKHWNCLYKTEYDLKHHFRTIPVGTSHWKREYLVDGGSIITFTDKDGVETGVCDILTETKELYKKADGTSKTFNLEAGLEALAFKINGDYAWPSSDQFTDLMKFVVAPRYLFVRVQKVDEIPSASMTTGTMGDMTPTPPSTDPDPGTEPDPETPETGDFKGTYKVKNILMLGGNGSSAFVEVKDKIVWSGTVANEYDNRLVINPTSASGTSVMASVAFTAGPDGKYWDYTYQAAYNRLQTGDVDLSGNFDRLPHAAADATISLADGTVTIGSASAQALMPGAHVIAANDWTKGTVTVPDGGIAVVFKCTPYPTDKYTYDSTWDYTDFDRFVIHPFYYAIVFEKESDDVTMPEPPAEDGPITGDPVSGTYKVSNLMVLGGLGSTSFVEIKDKTWMWNGTVNKEYDNILELKATGMSGMNITGKADYKPGADGAYWDYVLVAEKNKFGTGDADLSHNFGQLPHGESDVTLSLLDGSVTVGGVAAKAYMAGSYAIGVEWAYASGTLTVAENQIAIVFNCKVIPDSSYTWNPSWEYSDFDRFMLRPLMYAMIFTRQ